MLAGGDQEKVNAWLLKLRRENKHADIVAAEKVIKTTRKNRLESELVKESKKKKRLKDVRTQIIQIAAASASNDCELLGINKNGDRACVKAYVQKSTDLRKISDTSKIAITAQTVSHACEVIRQEMLAGAAINKMTKKRPRPGVHAAICDTALPLPDGDKPPTLLQFLNNQGQSLCGTYVAQRVCAIALQQCGAVRESWRVASCSAKGKDGAGVSDLACAFLHASESAKKATMDRKARENPITQYALKELRNMKRRALEEKGTSAYKDGDDCVVETAKPVSKIVPPTVTAINQRAYTLARENHTRLGEVRLHVADVLGGGEAWTEFKTRCETEICTSSDLATAMADNLRSMFQTSTVFKTSTVRNGTEESAEEDADDDEDDE